MEDCRDGFLSNCKALPGTDVFLSVTGEKTSSISLAANDLKHAKIPVQVASDVKKTEVSW
jgi:hypothetical protein